MSYSDELLACVAELYSVEPKTQAILRRAVSTAYYSLFHFLIERTVLHWAIAEQRGKLVRVFEHKAMLEASNKRVALHKKALPGSKEFHLYTVANAFQQLQNKRHDADYNVMDMIFAVRDVDWSLDLLGDAFASWDKIRNERIAQDYLFSLIFRERRDSQGMGVLGHS